MRGQTGMRDQTEGCLPPDPQEYFGMKEWAGYRGAGGGTRRAGRYFTRVHFWVLQKTATHPLTLSVLPSSDILDL